MARKPRLILNTEEADEIGTLLGDKRLVSIVGHKIWPHVVVCGCGDGHEEDDIYRHHHGLCKARDEEPMIHKNLTDGGALVLQWNWSLNFGLPGDELMIKKLGASMRFKETNVLVLRVHAPCRAARETPMGPLKQYEALQVGKSRMLAAYPKTVVCPFFDVRYADGKLRTYFAELD